MKIASCDPGCTGALALFDGGVLVAVEDMPVLSVRRGKTDKNEVDGWALAELLRRWAAGVLVIEQVGGIKGQAAGGSFNFGRAAGAPEYIAITLGMRLRRVPPITWKKALHIKPGKDDSRLEASRRWPEKAELFRRKKDDGRAEAALIGQWFLVNGLPEIDRTPSPFWRNTAEDKSGVFG